jgi:hypothetical protein
MKITTAKIIIIQDDGAKPIKYTDPRWAAEHWAQVKAEEWMEKVKDDPKYKNARGRLTYELFGDGKVRYRKLKRRALRVFRKVMDINS